MYRAWLSDGVITESRGIGAREYKDAAAYHRRVHVGFSLLTLFPGRVGGSEANVQGLLTEFAAGNGPERVTVLANRPVMEAYGDRFGPPVALHRVASYRQGNGSVTRLGAMTAAALAPGRIARAVPADIDLLHHPVTVPIPQLSGVPTVSTVYDLQHREMPGPVLARRAGVSPLGLRRGRAESGSGADHKRVLAQPSRRDRRRGRCTRVLGPDGHRPRSLSSGWRCE